MKWRYKSDEQEILDNRNRFKESHGLLRERAIAPSHRVSMYRVFRKMDHLEGYKTETGGVILLNNPYCLMEEGTPHWTLVDRLYFPTAYTYAVFFDNQAHYKEWIRPYLHEYREAMRFPSLRRGRR
jgi:hypothetical protein